MMFVGLLMLVAGVPILFAVRPAYLGQIIATLGLALGLQGVWRDLRSQALGDGESDSDCA